MDGLMMRRHALLARPLATPLTVSGPTPLLMPGALAKPMRKATFQISPVQAGSGDPSPQNVRPITGWSAANITVSGKNLYPYETITKYTYEWYAGSKDLSDAAYPFFLKGGKSYVLSYTDTDTDTDAKPLMRVWRADGTILEDKADVLNAKMINGVASIYFIWSSSPKYYNYPTYNSDNAVLIAPTEDLWIDARMQSGKAEPSNVMLNVGSTASPYTPYSGTSLSVTFPAVGANQWDEEWESGQYYGNTTTKVVTKGADNTRIRSKNNIPLQPSTAYYYAASQAGFFYFFDAGGNWLNSTDGNGTVVQKNKSFTTPANTAYACFFTINTATYGNDIAINYPSSVTTYEPYTNTIYGGTFDPVTGQGVVTHAMVDLGTLTFSGVPTSQSGKNRFSCNIPNMAVNTSKTLCSVRKKIVSSYSANDDGYHVSGQNVLFFIDAYSGYSNAEFKAAMSGVQFCYELATPVPFTIPPQSLTPPAGDAYIWADCGSSADVTYVGKA